MKQQEIAIMVQMNWTYIHRPVITEVIQELKSFHVIFTDTTIIIGYCNAQASTAKQFGNLQFLMTMYIFISIVKSCFFLLPCRSVYIYGIRYSIVAQSCPCTEFHIAVC